MNRKLIIFGLLIFLFLADSCIYPFEPEGIDQTSGILVIEGDIIAGGESQFKVSVSQELDDKKAPKTVYYQLIIENDEGDELTAEPSRTGVTLLDTKSVEIGKEYRVHVKTLDSKGVTKEQYYSEWLEVKQAPAIDSISFFPDEEREAMYFYISTHGDDTQTYYKWDYKEDWEYHSAFVSELEYNQLTNTVSSILGIRNRYYCWNNAESSQILIGNTSDASENRLIKHELYSISKYSLKISYIYSVELTQKAITAEAYNYWQTLSKNSDDAGGLFSPQPSELRGNYYNPKDSLEVVLGYVSATTIAKQRMYVRNADILFWKNLEQCAMAIVIPRDEWYNYYKSGYDVLFEEELDGATNIYWAETRCVDCRSLGGTKTKPSFWPNNHD